MKRFLFILLLLPMTLAAQSPGPGFGFWKAPSSSTTNPALTWDSTIGVWMASSVQGKVSGDTLYKVPNSSSIGASADAVQLTSSLKPIYRDTSGVPRIVFDGTDDVMSIVLPSSMPQPGTWLAVVKFYTTQVSTNKTIASAGSGSSDHALFVWNVGSTDPLGLYAGSLMGTSRSVTLDSVYALEGYFSGASSVIRNRGKLMVVDNAGTNTASGLGNIGGMSGGYFEWVYVHGTLTDIQRAAWLTYVSNKYGVPLP